MAPIFTRTGPSRTSRATSSMAWTLGFGGNPIGANGSTLDCNESESIWKDGGVFASFNIGLVNCIPSGSPLPECTGSSDCCKTSAGGTIGCSSGVCCNGAGDPCVSQNDCCQGNVCSNGACAIDDKEGYCATNGSNSKCLSTICDGGITTCICLGIGGSVGGSWWECCSGTEVSGSCSVNRFLGDGGCTPYTSTGCDTISQVCDPVQHSTCRITNTGSAYETCSQNSDCAQWPYIDAGYTMSCSTAQPGQCCNAIDAGCFTDKDCCVYKSCTAIGGNAGVCKMVARASCHDTTQCLYGTCSSGSCQ